MSKRLVLFGILIGLGVSVWIVKTGGPTERLTETWRFGLLALAVSVLVAETIVRLTNGRR